LAVALLVIIPTLWLVNMIGVGIFARRKGLNEHPAAYVTAALFCGCFVWIWVACASHKTSRDDPPKRSEYPLAPHPANVLQSDPQQHWRPHPVQSPYHPQDPNQQQQQQQKQQISLDMLSQFQLIQQRFPPQHSQLHHQQQTIGPANSNSI
jgi:hypothetical protein